MIINNPAISLNSSAKRGRILAECARTPNTAKVGMKILGVLKGEFCSLCRSKKQGKWKV